jgi:N-acetylmuramoyl-L-alanine amidase
MKRIFTLFCLLAAALVLTGAAFAADTTTVWLYDQTSGTYNATTAGTASLQIDGQAVATDMDPFILNGRTLVPARVVSETLGANVDWNADTQQVTVTSGDTTIILTIGSPNALVNGETVALPDNVAPVLVRVDGGSRTMVPVRFVSEQLGADVDWDNDSRTVLITSPQAAAPLTKISSIVREDDSILVTTDGAVTETVTLLDGRYVVDLPGTVLETDALVGQISLDGLAAADVRYSQFASNVVRLVFDLGSDATADDILLRWDGDTLVCTLSETAGGQQISDESQSKPDDFQSDEDALPNEDLPSEDSTPAADDDALMEDNTADGNFWDTVVLDPSRISILLDAGHGGSDPGCQYYGVDEKDITLAVTKDLGRILQSKGYQVVYSRSDDTYVSLEDRSDMANDLDVTIFVSVHVNAAAALSANGIETYYWGSGTADEKTLATLVQEAVIQATGANDRSVRTANYWVCRKTDMPAILVETGFLSNTAECANLSSDSYQQKLAQGIANGIVAFLNQYDPS